MNTSSSPIAYIRLMYFETNDKRQHVELVQLLGGEEKPFRVTLTRPLFPKKSKALDFANYEVALDYFLDTVTTYINNIKPLQQ